MFVGSPPIGFTFGLGGLVVFPMRVGAAMLLLERGTPDVLGPALGEYGATVLFTAPTAYRALLGTPGADFTTLRRCVSAGEPLSAATWQAFYDRTGLKIIDGIGSTEMLHIFISSADDEIRPGSTGRVVPGYEACVLDDDGEPVPDGTIGRLAVRGPTGCRYLSDERQAVYVQHGWNLTGDTYMRDEDGYFWYQARNDDMIISAGFNIAGPEVEMALMTPPGRARMRGCRRARRQPHDGRARVRRAAARCHGDTSRPAGTLPPHDRAVQDASGRGVHRRAAAHEYRKGAAVPAAGAVRCVR